MKYKKEDILDDIKNGIPLIITDDESRENEGDLFVSARVATREVIKLMVNEGRGLICAPMSNETASKLNLPLMVNENSSNHSTAFTVSVDHKNNSTGISVDDRLETLNELASEFSKADDFLRPGHIFPLIAHKEGLRQREGHTEAAVFLSQIAGMGDVGVICEILNEDGTVARGEQLELLALRYSLKIISIREIKDMFLHAYEEVDLPTKNGDFSVGVFEVSGREIKILKKGRLDIGSPVVRIHSSCFTGDIFGSLKCDCGEQLEKSIDLIHKEGNGIIIYMDQEGRGIGALNKIKSYKLQLSGRDTYEANNELGFNDDLRTYDDVSVVFDTFKIKKLRLITNNPLKIKFIKDLGIKIDDVIQIETSMNEFNSNYLMAKKHKKNHFFKTRAL